MWVKRFSSFLNNRRGLSIPELLIAITITGVVVGTAGHAIPSVFQSAEAIKATISSQSAVTNKWDELSKRKFTDVTAEARTTIDPKLKLDRQVVVTTTNLGGGLTKKDIDVRVYKTGTNELLYNLPMVRTSTTRGVPRHTHPPTVFSQNRNNVAYDVGVSTELRWRYYGNGYTVIDASKGDLPGGNKVNATHPWTTNYPTLVGYNGTATYGVRVDSARTADTLTGLTPNIAVATNSVAVRDTNGYLSANYLRSLDIPFADHIPAVAYYFADGSGYLRKKSLAAVKAELVPPPYGYQEFTANGTFTVPAGISRIKLTVLGGGGGGGGASFDPGDHSTNGCGGGGGQLKVVYFNVIPGTPYAVTIGAGGARGSGGTLRAAKVGSQGGTTSVAGLDSAIGGYGGGSGWHGSGGPGASGGGTNPGSGVNGGTTPFSPYGNGGKGGTDKSNHGSVGNSGYVKFEFSLEVF